MNLTTSSLNGSFGIKINDVTPSDLTDPAFQSCAYDLWLAHGGLLALRGAALAELSPDQFLVWSAVFGSIEQRVQAAREDKSVPGYPILRIGNIRNQRDELVAQFSDVPPLQSDDDIRYNPKTQRPVWHTDSTFREQPPIGSVFYCRTAPTLGAETLFADMHGAFNALSDAERSRLENLEAICSLAHHDKKINGYSPEYPVLTPEQRRDNPPRRVPIILTHPVTGQKALYGLNSSTCAIVPKGADISPTDLDLWDLEGVEDESVMIWRDMLPRVTGPEFTVKWEWLPGDIVIWDNRSTIHTGTGYDAELYEREMWRLTLLNKSDA